MSDIKQARRTSIDVFFAGVNISQSIQKYLLSLTYTDNEEDETDDLQLKLHDRDSIWLEKWLNTAVQAAAEGSSSSSRTSSGTSSGTSSTSAKSDENNSQYKVISTSGVAVHSRAGEEYFVYGTLAYGTIITVSSIASGWANFTYSGKNAYVPSAYLEPIYTSAGNSASNSASASNSSSTWNIGDDVIVTGIPQYSSYGTGTPGKAVTNYKGSITHLNLKSGIPYPVCVGYLGWFSENQVSKSGASTPVSVVGKGSKGLLIQATIARQNWNSDGKDEVLDCGQFELDSVVASGPPATINIKGTSLSYGSTVRQTQKSKSWEHSTLSGISNEIASKNGMTCMYLSSANPSYKRVEQYRLSDIAFLQKLCQDAGCSLKVTNNIIVVFDQAEYESKSSIRKITRGKLGGYIRYKLSTNENDKYTSCRVSCVTSSGKLITATAYVDEYDETSDNNQCLDISQNVSSIAEAMTLANKLLRLHNKYEFTANFTFPGDPKLVAGCTVILDGWGAWDGKYIIKQSKHTVSAAGYTTQIELRKALGNAGDSSEGSAFEVGDKVMCNSGVTTYYDGVHMATWVPSATLYVRRVESNGAILLVSTEPVANVYTGRVNSSDVHKI